MKTIPCCGDSNTWGMLPMASPTDSNRHPPQDRWPSALQAQLGASLNVIAEGVDGRTTVHDDPIDGLHLDAAQQHALGHAVAAEIAHLL
jgi:lysophospholipase L1-like esterase